MVTAYKAESKNEEIQDKVRTRAAVATDLGEGMAELGQQIARLMAALTKAGQGSNPSSAPRSSQRTGHGRSLNGSSIPSCPNSHSGRSVPGHTTPAHSLPTQCGTGAMELGVIARVTRGLG